VLFLVDHDRRDFSRRERPDHELRGVRRPEHDIDPLARELLGDRLHA
jgi:hypothetical protein